MGIEEEEIVLKFNMEYEDYRKHTFDQLYNKVTFILFGLIPLIGILIFEIIMIVIGLRFGFNVVRIFFMAFIPGLFIIIAIYLPIAMIVIEKIRWKKTSKLPKERTWIINNEGIIIDEIYNKYKYNWIQISNVNNNMKNVINFIVIERFLHIIPKRVLNEDQSKKLSFILKQNLEADKLKYYKES